MEAYYANQNELPSGVSTRISSFKVCFSSDDITIISNFGHCILEFRCQFTVQFEQQKLHTGLSLVFWLNKLQVQPRHPKKKINLIFDFFKPNFRSLFHISAHYLGSGMYIFVLRSKSYCVIWLWRIDCSKCFAHMFSLQESMMRGYKFNMKHTVFLCQIQLP